ncbi:hypothetical protein ACQ0QQ_06735 [Lysinibacillus sphaericus]
MVQISEKSGDISSKTGNIAKKTAQTGIHEPRFAGILRAGTVILSKTGHLLSKNRLYYQKQRFYYQKYKHIIKSAFRPQDPA